MSQYQGFPKVNVPVVDGAGRFTTVWYSFLFSTWNALGAARAALGSSVIVTQAGSLLQAVVANTGQVLGNLLTGNLAPGEVYVGNAEGQGTATGLTGDVSLSDVGKTTVLAIDGNAVSLQGALAFRGAFPAVLQLEGPTALTVPTTGTLSTTQFALAGTLEPNLTEINFSTGFSGSVVSGVLTLTAAGSSGSGLWSGIISTLPSQASTGLATWDNQGGASETDSAVGMSFFKSSNGGSHALNALYKTAPATPYTAKMLVLWGVFLANGSGYFLGWRSAAGAYDGLLVQATAGIYHATWNSAGTSNTITLLSSPSFVGNFWFQLIDNGTSVSIQYSGDGENFTTLYTTTKAGGFLGAAGYNDLAVALDAYNGDSGFTLASYVD